MHRAGRLWPILAIATLTLASLSGQSRTAEVRLSVTDPSGSPVEASGRLDDLATGKGKRFRTDSQGHATIGGLTPGKYRLEIVKPGFARESSSIEVLKNAPLNVAVSMKLSSQLFNVDVVATTPLPGVDLSRNEVAAPVQAATDRDIESSGALNLPDFLNRRLAGVHLNELQGNPFQPDLNYRGYTASPLLGTPQGVSVYMDGVRMNQPFGDVMSWDLIPRIAISEVTLIPGSNPLFGLNTLGGSVSIQTKDGRGYPHSSVQAYGGTYGRRAVEAETGGSTAKGLDWYFAGNLFHEDGWRISSPSDVRQTFGRAGWQHGATTIALAVAYADNELTGNGLQEQRFIARDYSSIYTKPDITNNRSPFFNLSVRHTVNSSVLLSGNAYYRYIRADTFNADLNENSLNESVYQPSAADIAAMRAAGYTGFPTSGANSSNTPFPFWRCIAQSLQHAEPVEKCNGVLTHTYTKQRNYGMSAQVTWFASPQGHRNQLTAGVAYDQSSVGFQQAQQFAFLNPDLSLTPVNAFADGSTSLNGAPYDTRVDLGGKIRTPSVYATDTLSIANRWSLTVSGRYNHTTIENLDHLAPAAGIGSLTGGGTFQRFNPAAGLTYTPGRHLNFYGSYSEGSRAPTSIELGCADPNQPCKLPNAMTGDPPLRQVVTRTFEAGVRGGRENSLTWNAGWFRAQNNDDLLFVASEQTGYGYFKNFGRTRRQGAEAGIDGRVWHLNLGGEYTFLDATYQSREIINGSGSSASNADSRGLDGNIQVVPGDRIPLVPRHMLKAFADLQATKHLSVDLGLVAISKSYARGNENNLHQPDGTYFLGPGYSPGYAVINLGARYQLQRHIELFAQINNLLDRHYYSAAQLGATGFTSAETFVARPLPAVNGEFPVVHATFYAPGAPRLAWGGLRIRF